MEQESPQGDRKASRKRIGKFDYAAPTPLPGYQSLFKCQSCGDSFPVEVFGNRSSVSLLKPFLGVIMSRYSCQRHPRSPFEVINIEAEDYLPYLKRWKQELL